jgi:hypothetical protein
MHGIGGIDLLSRPTATATGDPIIEAGIFTSPITLGG